MSHSFMDTPLPTRELNKDEKALLSKIVPILHEMYTNKDIELRLSELLAQFTVRR